VGGGRAGGGRDGGGRGPGGGRDGGGRGGDGQQTKPPPVVKNAAELTVEQLRLGRFTRARRLSSIFELVDTQVLIPSRNQRQPDILVPSPLNDTDKLKEMLPLLFDKTTTTRNADLPSRVNVNTAPRAVLAALPGLNEADVDTIIGTRPDPDASSAPAAIFQTPAWLLTEANLPVRTLRTLERFVTARTQVYRVQVVGHFAEGGPSMRVEAIIDTNRGRPRVVYWRDLSELGRGFALPSMAGP
jgi:hypothetical protein